MKRYQIQFRVVRLEGVDRPWRVQERTNHSGHWSGWGPLLLFETEAEARLAAESTCAEYAHITMTEARLIA